MNTEAQNVLQTLTLAAEDGLAERLKKGPLIDNTIQTKADNDRAIEELLNHLDLRYGISEWLDNKVSKIYPVYNQKTGGVHFLIGLPYDAFYREEGTGDSRRIVITGLCQTHANVIADLINATTTHTGTLAQAVTYTNSERSRHIITEISDTTLASPLERDKIDPGKTNREFDINDNIISKHISHNPSIKIVAGLGQTGTIAEFPTRCYVTPIMDNEGNIIGIESPLGLQGAVIDDLEQEGQIVLAGSLKNDLLFTKIQGKPGNHSWIIINLITGEIQRFDYGNSEACKRYAEIFTEKMDISFLKANL